MKCENCLLENGKRLPVRRNDINKNLFICKDCYENYFNESFEEYNLNLMNNYEYEYEKSEIKEQKEEQFALF